MPKTQKQKGKNQPQEYSNESCFLGKLGEIRSCSLSVFRDETYIHIHDYSKSKSVSMTFPEYQYLCSLFNTINNWNEQQKQNSYYFPQTSMYQQPQPTHVGCFNHKPTSPALTQYASQPQQIPLPTSHTYQQPSTSHMYQQPSTSQPFVPSAPPPPPPPPTAQFNQW